MQWTERNISIYKNKSANINTLILYFHTKTDTKSLRISNKIKMAVVTEGQTVTQDILSVGWETQNVIDEMSISSTEWLIANHKQLQKLIIYIIYLLFETLIPYSIGLQCPNPKQIVTFTKL